MQRATVPSTDSLLKHFYALQVRHDELLEVNKVLLQKLRTSQHEIAMVQDQLKQWEQSNTQNIPQKENSDMSGINHSNL